jgi:transketolase
MSQTQAAGQTALEKLSIDTVRVLSMDAVQKANSGHPGTPMALAPAGYALFRRQLRHNPANPDWLNRDRFVLSCGHASMLLYSLLYLTGYEVTLDDIKDFRQWGSKTPGHPEYGHTAGVETTTGPLGQGVANTVGMALAERWLATHYNRSGHAVVDHYTYALCSDGDLMEGISHEAAELAGHWKLGKLIWVFDDNRITIEGDTDLATSTDQAERFRGYGWQVLEVEDGEDLRALDGALQEARTETERPTLIVMRTVIGHGSPNMAGSAATHGAPLGDEEIRATKENLGYPSMEPFHIEEEALEHWREAQERGKMLEDAWQERWDAYRQAHPDLAADLERVLAGTLPDGWDQDLPDPGAGGKLDATRGYSGTVLQTLAQRVPNLIGGSADLGGSNKTELKGLDSLLPSTPGGRNVHYGVREHAMGAILNGMALHGGVRAYAGTFLIFSDYMRPAIRLAALMGLPVTYVFSHDSIGVGEDGPTHQPIEQVPALRAIPGLMDLRPGSGAETLEAWKAALRRSDGPSFLALTRQKLMAFEDEPTSAEGLHRGGYIFQEARGGTPRVILIASGSELGVAAAARLELQKAGTPTRVVSMPSWHLFQKQSDGYRSQVLPGHVPARVAVEAAASFGWQRWVGSDGAVVGIDHFGASAPGGTLFSKFGVTVERVVEVARRVLVTTEV